MNTCDSHTDIPGSDSVNESLEDLDRRLTTLSSLREYCRKANAWIDGEPASPNSISLRKLETEDSVKEWLAEIGLEMYTEHFCRHGIAGETLYSLTSRDLRDDVGIRNLSHRRRLMEEIARLRTRVRPVPSRVFLPEFGRILDHLSNVRTFHSWLRVGVQQLTFALALERLAPNLRSLKFMSGVALYCALTGSIYLAYGGWRYLHVLKMIDNAAVKEKRWWQDDPGIFGVSVFMLSAAVVVFVVIILDDS